MTNTCPFCGRRFRRSPRALLTEKFCRRCIRDRILASGYKVNAAAAKVDTDRRGYVTLIYA